MNQVKVSTVFVSDESAKLAKAYFLLNLSCKEIPENYEPTLVDKSERTVKYQRKDVKFTLVDTECGEDSKSSRQAAYNKADIVVFTFNLDNKATLEGLEKVYVPEVKQYCDKACKILVGLTLDKKEGDSNPVNDSEIEEWAQRNGMNATYKHTIKNNCDVSSAYNFFAESYSNYKKAACNIA